MAKLAGEAAKLAAEAGERATPALSEKVAATLHAAALDEETAEELRAGRLVREREAIGGFGAMSGGAGAKGPHPSASLARKPKTRAGRSARRPHAAKARRRRADAERREQAERRQRLAAARTDERHARRELEAAAKAIEHAETRAEAAGRTPRRPTGELRRRRSA